MNEKDRIISYVELVLENCECIILDVRHISFLHYVISKTLGSKDRNSAYTPPILYETSQASYVSIGIEDLDTLYYTPAYCSDKQVSILERITTPDITHISIHFTDHSEFYFAVPYTSYYSKINFHQTLIKDKKENEWVLTMDEKYSITTIKKYIKYRPSKQNKFFPS